MCNLLAGAAVHGTRNLSPGRGFLAGRDGTVRLGGVPAAIGMAQRAPATPPARNPRRGLLSTTPPSRESSRRPESPPTQPICRTQPILRTTREQAELRCRGAQPSERPASAAAPPAQTVGAEAPAWEDAAEAHVPSTVPSPRVAPRRRGAVRARVVRAVVFAAMVGCMAITSCVVRAHACSPLASLGWI